jgi:ABC-2 type transport system permease protein
MKYDVVNIALGEPIPEDCTCLVINNPASDLTSVEAATVSNYLANGGNLLLITSAGADSFKNIASLAAEFGLSAEAGTVNEGDANAHYPDIPGYIYPTVSSTHASVSFIAQQGYPVLVANTHAILSTEMNNVTVSPLFTTSEKAYSVVSGAKGEASQKNLAVVAEKNEGGKLLWIASGELLNESLISRTNGGNFYAFYTATAWMTGNYTSSLPEIPGIELSEPTITTTATDANVWGVILIFIVPGAVLGGGVAYWLWRRRR